MSAPDRTAIIVFMKETVGEKQDAQLLNSVETTRISCQTAHYPRFLMKFQELDSAQPLAHSVTEYPR